MAEETADGPGGRAATAAALNERIDALLGRSDLGGARRLFTQARDRARASGDRRAEADAELAQATVDYPADLYDAGLVAAARALASQPKMAATVSVGVASQKDAQTLERVMREAGRRLYAAKDGGRNRVVSTRGCPPAAVVGWQG